MGEAMQAVLGAAHHQDFVYPDKPHRLGTQLDVSPSSARSSISQRLWATVEEPVGHPNKSLSFTANFTFTVYYTIFALQGGLVPEES